MKTGEMIRRTRRLHDLSQGELAKRVGKDRTTINKIERGVRELRVRDLIRIAEALNVPPSTLIGDE